MKLTVITLLALFLASCRTSSETFNRQEELNRETFERLTIQQQNTSSVLDSILSRYKATILKTERIYSCPDSTGSQAIISETEYKVDLEGEKQTITAKNKNQNSALINDKTEQVTDRISEARDKETDSRLFKPPSWLVAAFFIILVISVFLYCRKRFVH